MKRKSIMDAACRAFIDEGYDRTSMDRIAEIASASKRTVYNHFASKEELFREVLDRMVVDVMQRKQIPYSPDASLGTQLAAFADIKIETSNDPTWRGMMKVVMSVVINNPDLGRAIMTKAEQEADGLETWLVAAAADGRLRVDDPPRVASVFWAMIGGAFFWPSVFGEPMQPAKAEVMKEELIRTFLARYAKGSRKK